MSFKTDSATARTIGIDTGKYTLHMIGLDEKGTIVLREKIARGRIAARLVNVPQCLSCALETQQDHFRVGVINRFHRLRSLEVFAALPST
jgi:hypothetical protein